MTWAMPCRPACFRGSVLRTRFAALSPAIARKCWTIGRKCARVGGEIGINGSGVKM